MNDGQARKALNAEKGFFFCENCMEEPYAGVTVTYGDKPKTPCANCGFETWIFEPTEGESE